MSHGTATAVAGYPPSAGSNPFAQGSLVDSGSVTATGAGSFAQGYAFDGGSLSASASAGFAQGYANGTGSAIDGQANGAFAQGSALSGGVILSTANGSFAQGYAANTGAITASATGAFAQGTADGVATFITASGGGSFAQGSAAGWGNHHRLRLGLLRSGIRNGLLRPGWGHHVKWRWLIRSRIRGTRHQHHVKRSRVIRAGVFRHNRHRGHRRQRRPVRTWHERSGQLATGRQRGSPIARHRGAAHHAAGGGPVG